MATAVFLVVFFGTVLAAAYALAPYLNAVYEGRLGRLTRPFAPFERLTYRVLRVDPGYGMRWNEYARAVLLFSVVSFLFVYVLERTQEWLPLNGSDLPNVTPDVAFNTAISFMTNTNWQSYSPEQTMSALTQMAALAVQNFASAAVGMAVAVALVRGFVRSGQDTIGNFWSDLVRGTLYVLLPLSLVLAVALSSQGVMQSFGGSVAATSVEGAETSIVRYPAASQVAIKHIGTNGGGVWNANSAHPLESPTPVSNFLENWALLLIPFSFPFLFGRMVGSRRQGVAILAAMLVIFGAALAVQLGFETGATPALQAAGLEGSANLEGKEQRFSPAEAAIFSVSTTGTSTGAVNSLHDSYTAVGGLVTMTLMLLGEVTPGGVGAGLYSILLFAIVTVFIAGLMVGRTPEFLGKAIGAREVKLSLLGILVMPVGFLVTVAVASVTEAGRAGPLNVGAHGFSEILYAFASAWNNNGSAFAGLTAATDFYDLLLGVGMLVGRFFVIIPVLALAGSLAAQRTRPAGAGTMPTASPIFVGLLIGVILLVGALNFFPALALGPIAEALTKALA